ncbi:hypothetical protein [Natronococcus jeotgali]|nr:hypothetical protein [Natronococcus jeotgali]
MARDLARFVTSTRTENTEAMIEVSAAVDVDTHEGMKRMVEWEKVGFV